MNWQWVLGGSCLLLASLAFRRGNTTSRLNLTDWLLAIILGLTFAVSATFWLSAFHTAVPTLQSDFLEYCTGVAATDPLSPGTSAKRSALPMLLPRLFYEQMGIFDALALGGIVSAGFLGATLYIWGRLIAGPIAGIAASMFGLTLGPLTLYTRTITSYPEMSLCFAIGAAATTYGVISKRSHATAIAGGGIGLVLLADVRGLFWAVPFSGILLLSILFRGGLNRKLKRLACFIATLWLSFLFGDSVYVPEAIGFQEQVDIRPMFYRFLGAESGFEPAYRYEKPWVWGIHSPMNIIDTAQFLLNQSTIAPPDQLIDRPEVAIGRKLAWNYLAICGIAGLMSVIACRNRAWRTLALLGTTCPFIVALYGNTSLLENHSRFYLQTLPGLALLLGIGVVVFTRKGSTSWKSHLAAFGLFYSVALGLIPTPMAPNAGWQIYWQERSGHVKETIERYRNGGMDRDPDDRHCRRALHRLELENKPMRVSFYSDEKPESQ